MPRYFTFALLATVVGCTSVLVGMAGVLPPGHGVTPEFLERSGCDREEFDQRVAYYNEQLKQGRGTGEGLVPRVGMDICDLAAMLGAPSRVDLVQVEGGSQMNWWYETGASYTAAGTRQHLVTLAEREGRPTVIAVVW
jgi:hypothetical protein